MSETRDSPYLSVIVTSRNDDHGQGMAKRMRVALASLIAQLERHRLDSEIVLVDYNPPRDKPLLKDALDWPRQTRFCTIRVIVVAPEIHNRFEDSDKLPFFGALAQNVGIQRARGSFILATPIDILFANELIELISRRDLNDKKIYRTDRLDVSREVAGMELSLDERLEFCRRHVTFIMARGVTVPVVRSGKRRYASKTLKFSRGGFCMRDIMRLHCNGGDFTLMSRDTWFHVKGWPEHNVLSLGAEVILYGTAYLHGIREEMLQPPHVIYHIEHDSRWNQGQGMHPFIRACFYYLPDAIAVKLTKALRLPYSAVTRILFGQKAAIGSLGVRYQTFDELLGIVGQMLKGERPSVFNGDDWGLGAAVLPEYCIVRAAWDGGPVGRCDVGSVGSSHLCE